MNLFNLHPYLLHSNCRCFFIKKKPDHQWKSWCLLEHKEKTDASKHTSIGTQTWGKFVRDFVTKIVERLELISLHESFLFIKSTSLISFNFWKLSIQQRSRLVYKDPISSRQDASTSSSKKQQVNPISIQRKPPKTAYQRELEVTLTSH